MSTRERGKTEGFLKMAVKNSFAYLALYALGVLLISIGDLAWTFNAPAGFALVVLGTIAIYFPFSKVFPFQPIWKRVAIYTGSSVFCFSLLYVCNSQMDPEINIAHFQSRTGNCSQFFGFAMKTDAAQSFLRYSLKQLPPSYQYIYHTTEDTCRSKKLVRVISERTGEFCSAIGQTFSESCFVKANQLISEVAPWTSSGILISAKAQSFIKSKGSFHQLSVSNGFIDMMISSVRALKDRAMPHSIVRGMQKRSVESLSKNSLDLLLGKDFREISGLGGTNKFLLKLGFESKEQNEASLAFFDQVLSFQAAMGILDQSESLLKKMQTRLNRSIASQFEIDQLEYSKAQIHELRQYFESHDPKNLLKQKKKSTVQTKQSIEVRLKG